MKGDSPTDPEPFGVLIDRLLAQIRVADGAPDDRAGKERRGEPESEPDHAQAPDKGATGPAFTANATPDSETALTSDAGWADEPAPSRSPVGILGRVFEALCCNRQ